MTKPTSSAAGVPAPPRAGRDASVADALAPLARWYQAAGVDVPETQLLAGSDLPEPYRQLLVHERDMTSTLEAFHGGRIQLRVLGTTHDGNRYQREVVLEMEGTGQPVEFGATHLRLDTLPAEARRLVIEARRPFGAILRDLAIPYLSRPKAYFRAAADATMGASLRFSGSPALYGRCNRISAPDGQPIADIVEILPPSAATVSSPRPSPAPGPHAHHTNHARHG